MKKRLLFLLIITTLTLSAKLPISIDQTRLQTWVRTIDVNAKVVQLNNQTQQIVSRLGGHLAAYYVKPGQKVRQGDKIARIKSLELSRMSAKLMSLKQQIEAAKQRLATTRSLYDKGLASRLDLNQKRIELAKIESDFKSLKTQLLSLGIDLKKIQKPIDTLIVHAHADGVVAKLLVPLHTNIAPQTPIAQLTRASGYFALAYLPIKEALRLEKTNPAIFTLADHSYRCQLMTLLPRVDETTQQAQAIFAIESQKEALLLDAFGQMRIALQKSKPRVTIKKSALTLFQNEWVVFIPNEEAKEAEGAHEADEEEEHGGEDHEDEQAHHHTIAYRPIVVHPIGTFGDLVAIEGLAPHTPYVSDGVWFVKSLLLKGALGEHGH